VRRKFIEANYPEYRSLKWNIGGFVFTKPMSLEPLDSTCPISFIDEDESLLPNIIHVGRGSSYQTRSSTGGGGNDDADVVVVVEEGMDPVTPSGPPPSFPSLVAQDVDLANLPLLIVRSCEPPLTRERVGGGFVIKASDPISGTMLEMTRYRKRYPMESRYLEFKVRAGAWSVCSF